MKIKKSIWISWGHQIRNISMSRHIGAKLYVFNYNDNHKIIRYLKCIFQTVRCLKNEKPEIVFAPNPSAVAICLLLCLKGMFHYKLVIDAHYVGVIAGDNRQYFQKILDYFNRLADMVIVTNEEHAHHIFLVGGNPFICQDPIPDLSRYYEDEDRESKMVFVICSFDVDEPYREIFEAAKILKNYGFHFVVSGNFNKIQLDPQEFTNITFLGYVEEHIFYSHLFKSNIVVDLTTLENCLVCGAYEAMAAEKVLVTSDTKALRHFFTHGTVFAKNNSDDICQKILEAYRNRVKLKDEISNWKERIIKQQQIKISKIYDHL